MASRRPVIIVIAVAMATWLTLSLAQCSGRNVSANTGPVTVNIKGQTFVLEVSADQASVLLGMGHRESIPPGTGMIFVLPDVQVRGFWMKHCLTDMDIIYLDARGYVTSTHHMTIEPPQGENESLSDYEARLPRYSSVWPAQFAIELPPGSVEQLNVRFEDKLDLDLDALKARLR